MPNRILREGILTSPKLAKLGWAEEVLYRRLMSVVDDFGRYYADPGIIRGHLYPRQLTKVSDADVGKWLGSCQDAGLVSVYPAPDGECYLVILNFGQQVRAQKSKFPSPPAVASKCSQTQANAPVFVFGDVFEDETGGEVDSSDGFDAFWSAYPACTRKAAKSQCLDKWKSKGLGPLATTIVAHVVAMAASEQWTKDKRQFVPAPLVYLNQARWEASTPSEIEVVVQSDAADKTRAALDADTAHASDLSPEQRAERIAKARAVVAAATSQTPIAKAPTMGEATHVDN